METLKEKILELYPEYSKVLGPYSRKDGRLHIVLNNSSLPKNSKGKLKTISYPKAIMEAHMGRRLKDDETIDHIDKNPLNNSIENLQVLCRSEHASLDVKRIKPVYSNCTYCGKKIELTKNQRRKDRKNKGVFCSEICSGRYGSEVKKDRSKKVEHNLSFHVEYYSNKDAIISCGA